MDKENNPLASSRKSTLLCLILFFQKGRKGEENTPPHGKRREHKTVATKPINDIEGA
jgi:hypothetical protein